MGNHMPLKRKLGSGSIALAVALVVVTLLACKKDEEPAPAQDAATAPAVTTPTPPATNALDAAAEEPKPTTVVLRTDGGIRDAGTKDAAVATGGGASAADLKAIQACCNAIDAESKKTGPNQPKYKTASGLCVQIHQRVKDGKVDAASARPMIRAQLAGAQVPAGC